MSRLCGHRMSEILTTIFLEQHQENDEHEGCERHHGNRDVAELEKITERAFGGACTNGCAWNERIATELEIGIIGADYGSDNRESKTESFDMPVFDKGRCRKDNDLWVEKDSLPPAEVAWYPSGDIRIKQTAKGGSGGNNAGKEECMRSKKISCLSCEITFFFPRRDEDEKEEDGEKAAEQGAKR